MNNIKNAALLILILLISGGCSKKFSGINWGLTDRNKFEIKETNFDYFSGKAKINFKDESLDIKAKANIRIRKDSVIWISFSAVGIQGARCLIDKDSITIINMMKKEYYVFNYDSLSKRFNFDINFDAIQSVALGNLINSRGRNDNIEPIDDYFILKQQSGGVAVSNYVSNKSKKIERVEMLELNSKNSATIRYYDFQMVEDQAFPYSAIISLFYKVNAGTLNTIIEVEYSKAEIEGKELKFPFSIPKKYERK